MGSNSIASEAKLLAATKERMRAVFGDVAAATESLAPRAARSAQVRHESLRSLLEPRSVSELLIDNPQPALDRRLRRLGISPDRIAEAAASDVVARLEGAASSARVELERLIGRNDLLAVRYLDQGQRAGRAVGRVVIRSSTNDVLGFGTGSMISSTLLMTNHHVLDSERRAADSTVEFNFQLGLDGSELAKMAFRLRPDIFFATSLADKLDVTIVAVDTVSISAGGGVLNKFGFNPLTADRDEILAGESVTIIQHPGGDWKQIALRENRVLRLPDTGDAFLYYETDTTPGSSGAPVFNDQWEVVALHHSGFPERDAQGRILTPEGDIWREAMGDNRIHWIANEGIRVAAIRDLLAGLRGLSLAQAALRDAALEPPSSASRPNDSEGQLAPAPIDHPPDAVDLSAPGNHGSAVWDIPLTISIRLGDTGLAIGAPVAPSNQTAASQASLAQPAVSATPSLPVSSSPLADEPSDADFNAANSALADASARPYYDADADQAVRGEYYSNISSTLNPSQLFDALSELVSRTHEHQLSYKPMLHLYPWVDLQPAVLNIQSIYSSQMFDPVEFIARDFEVARLRRERLARFRMSEAVASPMAEAAFAEALEAQLPYNCEHVVPQSWFQKKQPMRGDLHHLFACESGCNSFRSNTPYFDFADFREMVRSDCGKSESNKFEPNSGKGAVARATLYFLLRYPGEINATANEYTAERLQVLLQWHQDHPVTVYEQHRNQAIFAVQGNRNPLIDFAEWADHIQFIMGLG